MNFDVILGPRVAKTYLGGFHCFPLPLKLVGVLFAVRIKLNKTNKIIKKKTKFGLPQWAQMTPELLS